MVAKPDAIDESWSRLDPDLARAHGIKVVYGYLSHDSSKNLPAALIREYHKRGVAVWLGWESEPGRPLLGAAAGRADGAAAAAQVDAIIKTLGYAPANKLSIPFSCDRDVSSSQLAACLRYYEAASDAMGGRYYAGAYGEADLIDYLAKHGLARGMFQTYAWSGGRLSPHAALYQYQNGQTLGGASVDFDRVTNAAQLGAWWPPGHPLNLAEAKASTASNLVEVLVTLDRNSPEYKAFLADVTHAVWTQKVGSGNAWTFLTKTYGEARSANTTAKSVATVLSASGSGVLARVASLQAALAAIKPATITQNVAAVDVAATAEAVVAKIKALAWKAGA